MKRTFLIVSIFFIQTCFAQEEFSVRISIPQGSGLAGVPYKAFEIIKGKLNVISEGYLWDTLAKDEILEAYAIDDSLLTELKKLIAQTDSIGNNYGLCGIFFGWPRFFISFNDNGRKGGGLIANVYREHVYKIVDIFNIIYPDGDVIDYNKGDLIKQEKGCERSFFKEKNN